jgi:hypothetical protein
MMKAAAANSTGPRHKSRLRRPDHWRGADDDRGMPDGWLLDWRYRRKRGGAHDSRASRFDNRWTGRAEARARRRADDWEARPTGRNGALDRKASQRRNRRPRRIARRLRCHRGQAVRSGARYAGLADVRCWRPADGGRQVRSERHGCRSGETGTHRNRQEGRTGQTAEKMAKVTGNQFLYVRITRRARRAYDLRRPVTLGDEPANTKVGAEWRRPSPR